MTHVYKGDTSASVYQRQLIDLVQDPDYAVEVRDRPTLEMLNVVTEITNPRARCQVVPGRKLNPWLALSESLWLLAGRDDVASLLPYNYRITEFSDNGIDMYGAYGRRMHNQIEPMLERLKANPSDRRAVLQIWGYLDLSASTKDPPCNTQAMFKLREGKLHMLVTCRSNDLHWGLYAVNLIQFGILQEYVACRLGVEMGVQTHVSSSLHVYTDREGQKITDRMMGRMDEDFRQLPADEWLFPNPWPIGIYHRDFSRMCGAVLDGEYGMSLPPIPFFEFAEDFLRNYREMEALPIRHCEKFFGWIKMGHEFKPELIP